MQYTNAKPANEEIHIDPVCGMTVTATSAAGKYDYKGKTYYFCGPGCMRSFQKEPEKFLAPDYKPSM